MNNILFKLLKQNSSHVIMLMCLFGCASNSKLEKSFLKSPDSFTPIFVKTKASSIDYYTLSNVEGNNTYTFKIKNYGASYDSVYVKFAGKGKDYYLSLRCSSFSGNDDNKAFYSTFDLNEAVLAQIGSKISLDLSSKWSLMVKGFAGKGRVRSAWSELLSNVQFKETVISVYDTLNNHLNKYEVLYKPSILCDPNVPVSYEIDAEGHLFYPLKVSVGRKMPKYEIEIGLNDQVVSPIRIICDAEDDIKDINRVRKFEEFKLAVRAIDAHRQCYNNGFIRAFDLRDSEGNPASDGEDCFHGAIFELRTRGFFNDSIKGAWSEIQFLKFQCGK